MSASGGPWDQVPLCTYCGPHFQSSERRRALLPRQFLSSDPYLALLSRQFHSVGSLRNQWSGQFQLMDFLLNKLSGQFQLTDCLPDQLPRQFQFIVGPPKYLSRQSQLIDCRQHYLSRRLQLLLDSLPDQLARQFQFIHSLQNHLSGQFQLADCLLPGTSIGRAIPIHRRYTKIIIPTISTNIIQINLQNYFRQRRSWAVSQVYCRYISKCQCIRIVLFRDTFYYYYLHMSTWARRYRYLLRADIKYKAKAEVSHPFLLNNMPWAIDHSIAIAPTAESRNSLIIEIVRASK